VSELGQEKIEISKNDSVSEMTVQKRTADVSDSLSNNFKQTVNSAYNPYIFKGNHTTSLVY
jgi:hypothetical protein